MQTWEWKRFIAAGKLDARFTALYGENRTEEQRSRWSRAIEAFETLWGERDVRLFSVPGRSEISGNHTDHNCGCVLAAAVDRDIIAVVSENSDDVVRVKSEGFEPDTVVLRGTRSAQEAPFTSAALIRGICDGLLRRGHAACGFDAYTTSDVMKGSGLSSSAAFEVMIAEIENVLANGSMLQPAELAIIGQYAENEYFGKPSGLMDQTACAVGSFIFIDFEKPAEAKIEKLPFDLQKAGYTLCVTDTGGNHADLNEDYASVPQEMKAVAAAFGRDVLRGLDAETVLSRAATLREKTGDRAILRALHFFNENDRVIRQKAALEDGDIDTFLSLVSESGRSSFMYLQNVYTVKNVREQGLSLALAVSDQLLRGKKAAFRVHGGGFAGTIQAFVPTEDTEMYRKGMERVFGEGSCHVLRIRAEGATEL